ncbi:putative glutathione S-transferase [Tistlia consotensis]|uniref:Putative glutathione S-transferase n=1 Tax=Tistlia consotensis USBA 355 TaxID=560819 RepID=A0A1Y6BCR6_9PROT|nr:glutathione S-transferase family protein [Tistlia consotensis]SME97946.1 putative glutathione S-transferase [Tistlia consotensis USBA 355]SNR57328.1 putative glutathione S-transferase [Tistlia consotensis]
MGLLVDGAWHDEWYDTKSSGGRFVRQDSAFRNWVTADGAAGPTGEGGFAAEPGRYHLYVSLACPWAHRTLILRALKGLEEAIDVSVVHWHMGKGGWRFLAEDGGTGDRLFGLDHLWQLYVKAKPGYSGRATVPVLWDKRRGTIVSNESAEIVRMLNSAFDGLGAAEGDYYPEPLRDEIDRINARVYDTVNNGVYKAGFATSQAAYEQAVLPLFDSLSWLDGLLAERRYLAGGRITEADWRLFTTLLRFDPVYHGHFKCNLKRLVDFPNLWPYTRELYQQPGVAGTVDLHHIKHHYYGSHPTVNPTGIVPLGPEIDFAEPHGRG